MNEKLNNTDASNREFSIGNVMHNVAAMDRFVQIPPVGNARAFTATMAFRWLGNQDEPVELTAWRAASLEDKIVDAVHPELGPLSIQVTSTSSEYRRDTGMHDARVNVMAWSRDG